MHDNDIVGVHAGVDLRIVDRQFLTMFFPSKAACRMKTNIHIINCHAIAF